MHVYSMNKVSSSVKCENDIDEDKKQTFVKD